jgi:hypothetical protein
LTNGGFTIITTGMTMHAPTEQQVIEGIEAYAAARKLSPSTVCRLAVNDGGLIEKLRAGGSITLRRLRLLKDFISRHPPPAAA